jgi:hypothetical protein
MVAACIDEVEVGSIFTFWAPVIWVCGRKAFQGEGYREKGSTNIDGMVLYLVATAGRHAGIWRFEKSRL